MVKPDDVIIEVQELVTLGTDPDTGEELGNIVLSNEVTARELIRGDWEIYFPTQDDNQT